MLGLGALLALEITTSTPDALCPPLEEARAAVRARVGEVRGAYQAEFSLVRADDGRESLELTVREDDVVRLNRSLSLDGVGCEDAAQAIALVLERFFDSVEAPQPQSDRDLVPVPDSVPATAEPAASHDASPTGEKLSADTATLKRFELRAGIDYDVEHALGPNLGVSYWPSVWRFGSRWRLGAALDGTLFVMRSTERVREREISASTQQLALSLPLRYQLEHTSFSFGPWAQLRLQSADALELDNHESAYRVLPGVGGAARVAWSFSRDWSLGASVAVGGQLTGVAPRFVLRHEELGPKPVLVPQSWFGQAGLSVLLAL